jgi:hypothetical protein
MLAIPDTYPIDLAPLQSEIKMPYTLTPGKATGTFFAEAAKRRIVGSRFKSGAVIVPAQDFHPDTGESEFEFVLAPDTGTLNGFTQTAVGLLGLIRIDGSDVDFVHKILETAYSDLILGSRVQAVWSETPASGILAIAGFRLAPEAPEGSFQPLLNPAPPVKVVPYEMALQYRHAFGPYYGRLFDEIRTSRRLMGVRSSSGEGALIPPREIDDISHRPTGTWVEVAQTGTVRAMSIIHMEFIGQKQPPPYIYAEIMLDGASTRLIHNVAGIDMAKAKDLVKPGTRVRAVWRETRTGSLEDISHFEVIDSDSQPS